MLLLNLYLKVHIQFALANEDFELLFIKEYLLYISSEYSYVDICVRLTFLHPKNTPCSNARQSQSRIGVILLVARYGTIKNYIWRSVFKGADIS